MNLEELLVEFVNYLKKEESIQGTIDDDAIMMEYAREFLSSIPEIEMRRTVYTHSDPRASWNNPK